jgi:hypothetical protein
MRSDNRFVFKQGCLEKKVQAKKIVFFWQIPAETQKTEQKTRIPFFGHIVHEMATS